MDEIRGYEIDNEVEKNRDISMRDLIDIRYLCSDIFI